ncbi:Putative uncharacterized protein [Halomonas sp. R57-5]|jgi:hypothetical protein|nr:Putative uncharacterized protein [Halomonas sp. R57-5]
MELIMQLTLNERLLGQYLFWGQAIQKPVKRQGMKWRFIKVLSKLVPDHD